MFQILCQTVEGIWLNLEEVLGNQSGEEISFLP